jgi:hypothetical protein
MAKILKFPSKRVDESLDFPDELILTTRDGQLTLAPKSEGAAPGYTYDEDRVTRMIAFINKAEERHRAYRSQFHD